MDKLRIVLVACFAMITFMLIMEYAQFRDEKSKQQLLSQQSTLETVLPSADTAVDGTSANNDDVPSAPAASQHVPAEQKPLAASKDLINITTDTLFVQIDPQGGDIVHVALVKQRARIDTPEIPFVLLQNNTNRVYTAQSGLIGKNGTDTSEGRPLFHAEKTQYQLNEGQDLLNVDLTFNDGDVLITKRFSFKRNDYLIDVNYLIDNRSNENWQAAFYGQIRHDGVNEYVSNNMMGIKPYLGFASTTADERFKKVDFEDTEKKAFAASKEGGWIALIQHYFLSAWVPDQSKNNEFSTLKTRNGLYLGRVKSPVVDVAVGQKGEISAQFYVGPKDQYRLADISPGLDLSVDYGWLWMVAQPLYAIMYFINNGTLHAFGFELDVFSGIGNWGFSIILLTILVKLAFFSLNAKAYKSMAKMRAVQPKMLEIRDRYADDKQKQSQEMMALYSKEGVNPLGGCLPILVQMPVFISLYWVLLESVEMRHAPFIGYIKDLSAMDPYFVLPLLMGASMWFQQKLNPPPPDPMQAKVMQFLPIIFTFFFLFFPSGLVLYWVVNNLLSIAQQWIITRRIERETAQS